MSAHVRDVTSQLNPRPDPRYSTTIAWFARSRLSALRLNAGQATARSGDCYPFGGAFEFSRPRDAVG